MFQDFIKLLLDYSIDIIPPFLAAILISAILSEVLPEDIFEKILDSNSVIYVLFASITGALIPLCTCGMIPLASKLQKKGTSWLIIISFLTAGNASSITALIMTLVLGLKITLERFLFAVAFGVIVSYIFVLFFKPVETLHATSLHTAKTNGNLSLSKKITKEFLGLFFSFGIWILAAIFIASLISLFLKPHDVLMYTGAKNIMSPFLLLISGFPFYFCAGADIPISKALLEKGANIGSVLAFMTASPGVNLTSLLIYQKWLGIKNAAIYLVISALVCGAMGLMINM